MEKTELVQLCVDVVNNPAQVQQFSKGKDVDAKIRGKFYTIMGTEKPTMKDIRRHKVEIFEIMEEVLTETYLKGVNEDEFFMRFADVRNLALGDSQEFHMEDDGVVVISEHAGNNWAITRQKMEGGTSFTVKVKSYSAGIYGDFFLFVTGRLSFGKLVDKVSKGIQDKIYSEVSASFANALTKLPSAFQAEGSYLESELIDLVSHVEASTGSEPVVVGTRKALAKVTAGMNQALYSDAMKNELANTGRVSNVNGMTLVQLPAVHKANSFDFAYDDNQLLVLPSNDDRFLKIVFEGEDYVREQTDNTANVDMSFEYLFLTRFGVNTVFSSLFGVYTLTA